ncbi:MAG: beta-lactamase family protein [Fimbriimonadaceae bacterium]|nr:beta-lactamase family protein [Fimbriimonadaceae bacterium]
MSLIASLVVMATLGAPAPESWPVPKSIGPTRWAVMGMFDCPSVALGAGIAVDYLAPLGGEANARYDRTGFVTHQGKRAATQAVAADANGAVDLKALFGADTDNKVAYAYAEWNVAKAGKALALFGSDDSAVVWLNGQEVHRVLQGRALDANSDRFDLALPKGRNRILVKVENGSGGWGFALRVFDEKGLEVLDRLRTRRNLEELDLGPEGGSYFLGEAFPKLVFRSPQARSVFGSPIKVRWFGPDLAEVAKPTKVGRYAAVCEATTKDGQVYRRMVAFAKVPPGFRPEIPPPPFYEMPVVRLPLSEFGGPALNEAQQGELSRHVWRAFFEYFDRSESAAILAANLLELANAPKSSEPSWLQSGWLRNLEYQLDLRMKIEGRTARAVAPPRTLATPAPELRDGTETEAGFASGTVAKLRALCDEWIKDDPNGFSVLVARKGVICMNEGFGGYDGKTPFYPASIGKSIAGITISRAVDQGLLAYDEPLSKVLPDWDKAPADRVTLRYCFNHLTGFGGHASHAGLFNAYLDNALRVEDLIFENPGTLHRYNGDGYNLAGQVLELTTGKPMARHLYDSLFKPLDEPVTQFDNGFGHQFTARFLGKVGQMLLQDGRYGKHEIFSPGFVRRLMPQRIADTVPVFPDKSMEWGIGLTWMIDPEGPREKGALGPNVVGHGSASASVWRVAPDHDLVVVIGRNAFKDYAGTGAWAAKFMAILKDGMR